jgi:mRNA interferase MazF
VGSRGSKPQRWEIWEVNLDPAKGREQKGVRPCLVISTDALNQSNFGTVIVCPLTTAERPNFRWRTGLVPADLIIVARGWGAEPNWVETDQIATIDVALGLGGSDARGHLATLRNAKKQGAVSDSIRMMLGLS